MKKMENQLLIRNNFYKKNFFWTLIIEKLQEKVIFCKRKKITIFWYFLSYVMKYEEKSLDTKNVLLTFFVNLLLVIIIIK